MIKMSEDFIFGRLADGRAIIVPIEDEKSLYSFSGCHAEVISFIKAHLPATRRDLQSKIEAEYSTSGMPLADYLDRLLSLLKSRGILVED